MKIDDVHVADGQQKPVTAADVDETERVLGLKFPDGYRQYITRFGEGTLAVFVRVYAPWRVANQLLEWRERISTYWFWEESERKLSQKRASQCVCFADTLNGDEFCFHPSRPDRVYVLPRDEERAFVVDGTLWDVLEWACTSGKLADDVEGWEFKPFKESTRAEISYQPPEKPKRAKPPKVLPERTPEQTLIEFFEKCWKLVEAYWKTETELEEVASRAPDPHRPGPAHLALERENSNRFKDAKRALWQQMTAGLKCEVGRVGNHDYEPGFRDELLRTEIKGSKSYVYARGGKSSLNSNEKLRWVLEVVDGEWKIKERQKEGMKLDKYNRTYID